jgi:hypothetical protein
MMAAARDHAGCGARGAATGSRPDMGRSWALALGLLLAAGGGAFAEGRAVQE